MDSFNGPFLVPLTPRARRSQGHPQRQCFNSHPARRPDATGGWCSPRSTPPVFQSSPGQKAGCNRRVYGRRSLRLIGFQSSPGQKAGCNVRAAASRKMLSMVSILTRPEGRMQHWCPPCAVAIYNVSILTRPEGRMQQRQAANDANGRQVSILTRPEGRMQPLRVGRLPYSGQGFNPHPARRPDATSLRSRHHGLRQVNPHPARRPDATPLLSERLPWFHEGFNPHPARRPDATPSQRGGSCPFPAEFQSSPGQKAGCNLRVTLAVVTNW